MIGVKGKNVLRASEATVVAALQEYFDRHVTSKEYSPLVTQVRANYHDGAYTFDITLEERKPGDVA